ncbi:hypothetical protein BDV93DRAFT_248457 [Ceratobasidium sp. AG-I]|nr:hypothetical protein BDV93DRAFT_248457 [Ceratobasidium sp. AG-I]
MDKDAPDDIWQNPPTVFSFKAPSPSPEFISRVSELRNIIGSITPSNKSSLKPFYDELLSLLCQRYQDQRSFDDLKALICTLENLINSECLEPGDLAKVYYEASCYILEYCLWSETTSDMKKVIDFRHTCVQLTDPTQPLYCFYLSELGAAYLSRYKRLGVFERDQTSQLNDLNQARHFCRQSVELQTPQTIHISKCKAQLGAVYTSCFDRFEDPLDLESAQSVFLPATESVPGSDKYFAFCQSSLGLYHLALFKQHRRQSDLESAVEAISTAVAFSQEPIDEPHLPQCLYALAACYVELYRQGADLNHLHSALDFYQRAINDKEQAGWRIPRISPDERALCHSGIGMIFTELYKLSGSISDLNSAIKHDQLAVDGTGWVNPELSSRQVNLALNHFERYKRLNDPEDYRKADRITVFASNLVHVTPLKPASTVLRAAMLAIKIQREKSQYAFKSSHTSLEPYRDALGALPQVSWLGKDIALRQLSLTHRDIVTLAVDGAAWGIMVGKPTEAVEILEEGRTITFRQLLQLRSDFESLLPSAPELAVELKKTAIALQNGSFVMSSGTSGSSSQGVEDTVQQQRALADRWQTLLKTVRRLPGMGDFLRARPFEELRRAAEYGPVVVLNCSDSRCDAVVLAPWLETCQVLPLEQSSRADAEKMVIDLRRVLGQTGRNVRDSRFFKSDPVNNAAQDEGVLIGILAKLWATVVKPVVDFILPRKDEFERVWWCPTGFYTSLPIHAAGLYASPNGPRLSNFFKSSYIPTLETLLREPESLVPSRRPKMLGISMPTTPGQSALPCTAQELDAVRAAVTPLQEWNQLSGPDATTSQVLNALGDADWLHLACHGVQNVAEPLASALLLHDGALHLRQIMQATTKPGLVFLSACQTAAGDRAMQDEAMHIAGGFLFAGFRGAIATMWSIDDQDGPTIASEVYKYLMREGKVPDVTETCAALHEAVQELRRRGVSPLRWVPFIHLGV